MTEPRSPAAKARPEKATLSRNLADFLIELSISLNKHAIYPADHPSLGPASRGVANRVADILIEKTKLSLGVAQEQLIIEGVATDPANPVLRELAGRLHRHHIGAIMFSQGLTAEEVHDVLGRIASEADRGEPLGLGPAAQLAAWPHVRLYPMTFDSLELSEEGQRQEDVDADLERTGLSAQLWLGLARAAMAVDEADQTGAELTDRDTDPTVVAAAIDANKDSGAAYDQVIVGYMMQIAEELKSAEGSEATALKSRMSRLISTLSEDTLTRLLEMGGDRDQRKQFLLNAAEGMTADAVLELVETAGKKDNQNISNSMLRMLQKMSQHAEFDRGKRAENADRNLRDQMSALVKGWSLVDPNPDGYGLALEQMSGAAPVFQVAPEEVFNPEPIRILQMALEVDVGGAPVTGAVETLVESGQLAEVLQALDEAEGTQLARRTWTELSKIHMLHSILRQEPMDVASVDRLLDRFGELMVDAMLDVLTEAESSSTRRTLIDRLVALGPVVASRVVARLRDHRWYVQRNMLNIIASFPQVPDEFPGAEFMQHEDVRVRREAFNILFRDSRLRERAICRALSDPDDRAVYSGLGASTVQCPAAAIPLVVSRATDSSNQDLQVAAIRVLDGIGGPNALAALMRVVEPRRSMFGSKIPAKSPGYLAALRAIQAFASDPRVRKALTAAARSRDPEVARAATTPLTPEANVETN